MLQRFCNGSDWEKRIKKDKVDASVQSFHHVSVVNLFSPFFLYEVPKSFLDSELFSYAVAVQIAMRVINSTSFVGWWTINKHNDG